MLCLGRLKPEKLQIVIFENKAVVDAHGCIIHLRVRCARVVPYIHSVGFCIAYSRLKVFPTTSDLDAWHKQRHASRFFNTKKKEPLGAQ